ncbi:MAG: hypothetical protein R2706_14990 [Acidimicrobiales bacterium]
MTQTGRWKQYGDLVLNRQNDLAALQLDAGATAGDIRSAYRQRAKACHPDLGGDRDAMIDLSATVERLLSDTAYGPPMVERRRPEPAPIPESELTYEGSFGLAGFDVVDEAAYGEPEGWQRFLITMVAFPLIMTAIVAVLVLLAT